MHYKWAIVLCLSGTADGTDYTELTSNTISFAANEDTKTCVVTITNDEKQEPSEDFTVVLWGEVQATLGSLVSTVVTISDDNGGLSS